METLAEARKYVESLSKKGVECPCCEQYVKVYKRKLNSFMAFSLTRLYKFSKTNPGEWVHIKTLSMTVAAGGGEMAKLRYWGLLEENKTPKEGQKFSGLFRITEEGQWFVEGETSVPKYIFLYNQRFLGFDESAKVTIKQALGSRFNYQELMAS